MSELGSRPKIASGSSTEPAALPSSETILSSMSGTFGLARLVRFSRRCFAGAAGALRQTELAGFGSVCRQSFLHRIAKRDPTALRARHRALDQDEAALDVGLHHLEVESGDTLDAQVPRHFLILERLDRKSTRLNSSHTVISYAVFCLKKKINENIMN